MSKARHARPSKASKALRAAGTAAVPGVTVAVLAMPASAATLPVAADVSPHPSVSLVISQHPAVLDKASVLEHYQVRPGDSLSSIAQSECGNPADWTGIYERNKPEISDPDLIYAGEQLVLNCSEIKVQEPVTTAAAVHPDAHTVQEGAGGDLSFSGLESLWQEAGGPSWAAWSAATIAECESGGRQYAENPSGASGYWQILGEVVPGNVFDPMVNAENAVAKFRASGDTFAQWVCKA